ncbi:uncharacterized protein DEA37_0000632 [Paragonimus westermani]|uniref:Integrase zinc-binding domain-containing protein n=1 Tax=Paragonimus westermani TaxID=34504 RepID=A0A5J4NUV8_9TREM|nr:uncharacterized protein DEA37_0000632 [Paragonimus westermani]
MLLDTLATSSQANEAPDRSRNTGALACRERYRNAGGVIPIRWKAILGMEFLGRFGGAVNLEDSQLTNESCLVDLGRGQLAEGCFAVGNDTPDSTSVVHHEMDTSDLRPIRRTPRRTPVRYEQHLDTMVTDMYKKRIIRPSVLLRSSPVVLVKKKNEAPRLCVNYRELSEITAKESLRTPRFDATLDALRARWQERLQEYRFVREYRRGSRPGHANALSRVTVLNEVNTTLLYDASTSWAEDQLNDSYIANIYQLQANGLLKPSAIEMKQELFDERALWGHWKDSKLTDRVLYQVESAVVLSKIHTELGHAGQLETEAAIRQRYWWPGIQADVATQRLSCEACSAIKNHTRSSRSTGTGGNRTPRTKRRRGYHESAAVNQKGGITTYWFW